MPPKASRLSASAAQKSVQRVSQGLTPYSVTIVPAAAPPPVARNPKRHIVLDLDVIMPATGDYILTVDNIRQAIANQTSVGGVPLFVIEYIHAWGAITPAGNASLAIICSKYSTTSAGDNTTMLRPRVGLMYPKNAQYMVPASTTNTTPVAALGLAAPATDITLRIGLTYWGSGTSV